MSTEFKKPYAGIIQGRAHYFALRVYIEDTDFGGVVYYANYLKFLERARSDLLRLLGIDQRSALELGTGVYAVSEAHIKYRRSARLEDELVVVSKLEEMRGASCVISQSILRGEETLAEATITVAFLGPEGRPKRQPSEWVEKLQRVMAPRGLAQ